MRNARCENLLRVEDVSERSEHQKPSSFFLRWVSSFLLLSTFRPIRGEIRRGEVKGILASYIHMFEGEKCAHNRERERAMDPIAVRAAGKLVVAAPSASFTQSGSQ